MRRQGGGRGRIALTRFNGPKTRIVRELQIVKGADVKSFRLRGALQLGELLFEETRRLHVSTNERVVSVTGVTACFDKPQV